MSNGTRLVSLQEMRLEAAQAAYEAMDQTGIDRFGSRATFRFDAENLAWRHAWLDGDDRTGPSATVTVEFAPDSAGVLDISLLRSEPAARPGM